MAIQVAMNESDVRGGARTLAREPRPFRVLLVEDEITIGMDLAMTLADWGYVVDGPHGEIGASMDAIHAVAPDLAILDVNLGDENSFCIASELNLSHTPFLFLTGYARAAELRNDTLTAAPKLSKPVDFLRLRAELGRLAAGRQPA